jgi:hypothetical protein
MMCIFPNPEHLDVWLAGKGCKRGLKIPSSERIVDTRLLLCHPDQTPKIGFSTVLPWTCSTLRKMVIVVVLVRDCPQTSPGESTAKDAHVRLM